MISIDMFLRKRKGTLHEVTSIKTERLDIDRICGGICGGFINILL